MTDRELMQQALDALDSDNPDAQLRAATAIRARLAQQRRSGGIKMTDNELMQMALDALLCLLPDETDDNHDGYDARDVRNWRCVVEALRARLAQPDAEPMYLYRRKGINYFISCDKKRHDELSEMPEMFETRILYTAPPQREWQGLTDEEIDEKTDFRATVRYFEAKLKEKNSG